MGLVIIYCISFQMFAMNEEVLMKGRAFQQTLRWTILKADSQTNPCTDFLKDPLTDTLMDPQIDSERDPQMANQMAPQRDPQSNSHTNPWRDPSDGPTKWMDGCMTVVYIFRCFLHSNIEHNRRPLIK